MWVRRALQRAEPGAQPRYKGEPRTGMLGAGFWPTYTFLLSRRTPGGRGAKLSISHDIQNAHYQVRFLANHIIEVEYLYIPF
jgi:hypothetical protein